MKKSAKTDPDLLPQMANDEERICSRKGVCMSVVLSLHDLSKVGRVIQMTTGLRGRVTLQNYRPQMTEQCSLGARCQPRNPKFMLRP